MGPPNGEILIVDDEVNALRVLASILEEEGYVVSSAADVMAALKILARHNIDAVITDFRMPGRDGIYLFNQMKVKCPDVPVIFLTAFGTVDAAVEAMTDGAFYYFIKPPDYDKLKAVLMQGVEQRRRRHRLAQAEDKLRKEHRIDSIRRTPSLAKIQDTVSSIKDSSSSVLIYGETGTGKELVAKSIHYEGARKNMPFVALNCAAIPRELLESELFGYEKGAFSGASSRRIGRVEEANGGTLFLDEIGELELALQAKLLRVLQEREIERLGSNRKIKVDFRLVSSTNRDLRGEIANGTFRDDLFYRLNVVQIHVPPLRERLDDIPLLVGEFVEEFAAKEGKRVRVSDAVLNIFRSYSWPGNIRQLRNVVERAVVLARGATLLPEHLPEELRESVFCRPSRRPVKTLRETELDTIRKVLLECHGNKSRAAKLLGISRKALYRRLEEGHV